MAYFPTCQVLTSFNTPKLSHTVQIILRAHSPLKGKVCAVCTQNESAPLGASDQK